MHYSKKGSVTPGLPGLVFFVLTVFLLAMAGCHPALKFAAVKYPAADINKLLDESKMKYLTIQFNSPDVGSYKAPFTLVSYARDSSWGYIGSPYYLGPAEGTKPATFKGKAILGNITVERDSLISLLSPHGERIRDFKHLLFRPRRDADYNYIYYDIFVVTGKEGEMKVMMYSPRPCPPATNCPAPPVP